MKRVQRRVFGSKESSNKMEDIAAYSEEYYFEILSSCLPNTVRMAKYKKKKLYTKNLITCPYSANDFSSVGESI